MSLLSLPNELLLQIASYLTPNPLNNLLLMNRRLTALLTPNLYTLAAQIAHLDITRISVLHWAAARGHTSVIRNLLLHNAPIDPCDRDGSTPLLAAAAEGQVGAVKTLLSAGADMHASNLFDETALHVAAESDHAGVIVALVESPGGGKLLSECNFIGQTPLDVAVERGGRMGALVLRALERRHGRS